MTALWNENTVPSISTLSSANSPLSKSALRSFWRDELIIFRFSAIYLCSSKQRTAFDIIYDAHKVSCNFIVPNNILSKVSLRCQVTLSEETWVECSWQPFFSSESDQKTDWCWSWIKIVSFWQCSSCACFRLNGYLFVSPFYFKLAISKIAGILSPFDPSQSVRRVGMGFVHTHHNA